MDIDEFWHLIELSRQDMRTDNPSGNHERFIARLEQLLRERGPEAVVQFSNHFEDRMREAYNFDLWAAAYLIAQGCSDDWFAYFRCWLISMGRAVYEQALENPDSLAEPTSRPDIEDVFFEALHSVPWSLYEQMTGTEIPDYPGRAYPDPPPGTRHRDDASDLPRRFPALWAKYGELLRHG